MSIGLWGLLPGTTASARLFDQDQGLDVSYKLGFTNGTMSRPADGTTPPQEFQYAGMPATFALNHEMAAWFSFFYEGQVVFDFANEMVTRKGASAGVCGHMLGGSRSAVIDRFPGYTLRSKNSRNLSACARMSYFSYSASSKTNLRDRATGSIVENLYGLQYRQDVTDQMALGIEAFFTLFNIPASVERLDTRSQEVSLFLRTYI
jgi:hypothetical protein